MRFKSSQKVPSKKTSERPPSVSTNVFLGNPASIVFVLINSLSAKNSKAHSKTSTPGRSISQESILS